jgi:hypothetical protein
MSTIEVRDEGHVRWIGLNRPARPRRRRRPARDQRRACSSGSATAWRALELTKLALRSQRQATTTFDLAA